MSPPLGVTENVEALVAVPPAVVTLQAPELAPDGTVAVIDVAELTANEAETPPSVTEVAPLKFEPVRVTLVPSDPLAGLNPEIVGAGAVTVKVDALTPVPPSVVTLHVAELAAFGTVTVIWVAEFTTNDAAAAPSLTDVAPVKFAPVNVTLVPAGPLDGLKPVTVGAGGGAVTVKLDALVAVPPTVVTLHVPELAPAGTVAVIFVAEFTVNDAVVEPSFTDVAPVKFVPFSVTMVPTGPLDGLKLVRVGAGTVTVNVDALVSLPPGVVTLHVPELAPAGTVAVICVAELTVNDAVVPASFTDVAPVRFVPVSVTLVPTGPLDGLKPVSVGAGGGAVTVKLEALVAVPPGVVTLHVPELAPAGTVAVICVAELTVNDAVVPASFTDVAPVKLVPVSVTLDPTRPLDGLNPVSVGAGTVTVNVDALVAAPPGAVTLQVPELAPAGTVVVICVAELTVNDAVVPASFTDVAPVKLVPVSVTLVPTGPLDGLKPDTVGTGGAVTVKLEALVVVPPAVVTLHVPELAPDGTVAVICVAELTVNDAVVPASFTDDAPPRFVPVNVTLVPTVPLDGLKPVSVGVGTGPVVSVRSAKP